MTCVILGENPPANVQDLRDATQVIVNSLMISANLCEGESDLSYEINAAIDAKLNNP